MAEWKSFTVLVSSDEINSEQLHSSLKKLNTNQVPINLRHLVPLAEKWGENNDILRERLIDSLSRDNLNELIKNLAPQESEIFEWLSGKEAHIIPLSEAYIAFSAIMMIYDATKNQII